MLNILGISRFLVFFSLSPDDQSWNFTWGQWGTVSFAVAIGVLPYPITFLCTDLISEFYGRRRANWVVSVGLILNLWVVLILWIGGLMPQMPPMDPETGLPSPTHDDYAFYRIRALTFGAVTASMLAYMAAQFCDVWVFHFWKSLTKGRHLWLRNNGSTLVSQLVDTVAVILITHFWTQSLPLPPEGRQLWLHLGLFIATGYAFKFIIALLDTIPVYVCVNFLRNYLQFDPVTETDLSKAAK